MFEAFNKGNHMINSVAAFNQAFRPTVDFAELIKEEFSEWVEANEKKAPEEELKELCDMLYVILGYCLQKNYSVEPAFNRVHDSNMSKLGDDGKPVYREDGKVMKGPNYKKPNLEGLV